MSRYKYVVIGAGNAGRTAMETLLDRDFKSSKLLIDNEACLPYKRTQVSKNVKQGFTGEAFAIHDSSWYEENGIDLRTGTEVSELSPGSRSILAGHERIEYEHLLLATGALPRTPFPDLPSHLCSTLWTKDDALRLRRAVKGKGDIAVIGTSVLGVEAAWQFSEMGLNPILLGASDYPMSRYLDGPTAEVLFSVLADAGVTMKFGHAVEKAYAQGEDVILETRQGCLKADFTVLTMGSAPNTEIAISAGLKVGKGILVDEYLKTSEAGIWAAGDCAEHPKAVITGLWHSAEHQGRLAAMSMSGSDTANTNPPYRLKCEVFGGLWFSGGPVNAPVGSDFADSAETWESGGILWRPRFQKDSLVSLAGAAPGGMDKVLVKRAQKLLLESATRKETGEVLGR